MSSGPVAVIDIGSNSIKILVALRAAGGGIIPVHTHTLDARISAGLGQAEPRLTDDGMNRGIAAIRTLLAEAGRFGPSNVALVATSAVRDARNGGVFCQRIRADLGHDVRVLSGEEEANLIGRGLVCDPALQGLRDFAVFDLGGGSLECLAFHAGSIEQAVSLPLGCVRLTERFVTDPTQPLSKQVLREVAGYTCDLVARSSFRLPLPAGTAVIGTGGTVTTVRAILGAREGKPFDATPAVVAVEDMIPLLTTLADMPLELRKKVPGLPVARADVFPVALATLIAIAGAGGFLAYRNSLYNLRYGVADGMLS